MLLRHQSYDSVNDINNRISANNSNTSNTCAGNGAPIDNNITTKDPPSSSLGDKTNTFGFGSIWLENKGSVARDHMANERTFLAWLRTSLSFITIGIGVTQLFRLEDKSSRVVINNKSVALDDSRNSSIIKYGKPLGSIFIILGIITLLFGIIRFFQVQTMLTKNYYPASRLSLMFLILAVLVIISVTFLMVLKTAT